MSAPEGKTTSSEPRLLDRVREEIRIRHYAYKTEKTYIHWIVRYVRFHHMRHPSEMGAAEITRFLTHLAVGRHVAESTQNQALNAIVFLYKKVLKIDVGDLGHVRADRPKNIPVVMTVEEVDRLLDQLQGTRRLLAELMYGTGMRIRRP